MTSNWWNGRPAFAIAGWIVIALVEIWWYSNGAAELREVALVILFSGIVAWQGLTIRRLRQW